LSLPYREKCRLVVGILVVGTKVTTQVELAGLFEAFIRLEAAEDGGHRKNEPERLGFGREVVDGIIVASVLGFVFGELDEEAGLLFRLLNGGFARGLERSELDCVLFNGAADALLVRGEELEAAVLLGPGAT
jgi:hypothetical protein